MDRGWLIAFVVVAMLAMIALRAYIQARLGWGLFAGNGPGTGRFAPSLLAAALAVAAGVMVGFTDNWWWALLAAPSVAIGLYVARQRRRAGVADAAR